MKKSGTVFAMLVLVPAVFGCQIPVFRFALERWASDPYSVIILNQGGLTAEEAKLAEVLGASAPQPTEGSAQSEGPVFFRPRETPPPSPNASAPTRSPTANIQAEILDVSQLTENDLWRLPVFDENGPFPKMLVSFPPGGPNGAVLQSPLTAENVRNLLDSPVRRKIVERILAGDSAVWLFLQSGDPKRDRDARTRLETALASAQEAIALPDGVLTQADLAKLRADGVNPEIDLEDVTRSEIPLRITFSVISIAPDDPAEATFLRLLTALNPTKENQPLAVPVFGRGRVMPGIPGPEINTDSVFMACEYLCSACSCQVKDENPGLDMLFTANWQALIGDRLIMVESPLPPLVGISSAAAPASVKISALKTPPAPTSAPAPPRGFPVVRLLIMAGVITLVVGAITTAILSKP